MALDFNTAEIGQKVRVDQDLAGAYDSDGFVIEKRVRAGREVIKVRFTDGFENWYRGRWLNPIDDNVVMFRKA